MKRYVIFYGSRYYPDGGIEDYHSDYSDLNKAFEVQKTLEEDGKWVRVADMIKKKTVWEWDYPVPKERWGVHRTYCCSKHGCKYGYKYCPVEAGELRQDYPCEDCNNHFKV